MSDGNHAISLSCTSTSFCLETDDTGYASAFNGSGWSSPVHVDSFNSDPELYSSCVGTSCVAVDYYDNFFHSDDGTSWTSAVDIHSSTLIAGIESLTCATATLCVAGDGVGDATTYAVPPAAGKPALTGTPTVGHTLYADSRDCPDPRRLVPRRLASLPEPGRDLHSEPDLDVDTELRARDRRRGPLHRRA